MRLTPNNDGLAAVLGLDRLEGRQQTGPATFPTIKQFHSAAEGVHELVIPIAARLLAVGHEEVGPLTNRNSIRFEESNLTGIGVEPHFAIGQRALLVRTPRGNFLWDCVPLLDPATVEMVKALGGISAIAISHPHYYTSMVEWSRAFGGIPIFLHAADRQWVVRSDKSIAFWDGETKRLGYGLTLIRCGGHFDGGTVFHLQDGAAGKGALLTGDIIQVVADRKHVSFMYSYPNYVPLSVAAVERIVRAVEPFEYEKVYGAFWDTMIEKDGKSAVARSAKRYLRAIQGQ